LNDRFNQKISVCKIAKGAMFIHRDITVMDALEEIRDGTHAATITNLRDIVEIYGKDTDEARKAKLALPAFLLSGRIDGRVAKAMDEGRFHHAGLLQLDFDKLDDPAAIRDQIAQDPHVLSSWISPSGDGVKGLFVIESATTEAEHLAAFIIAEKYWHDRGLTLDSACKNSNRLCFASHDPDLKWNEDAVQLTTAPPPRTAPKAAKTSKTSAGIKLKAGKTAFPEPPREGIHTWLMEAAWHCRFAEMSESDTVAKLQGYEGSLRRSYQPTEVVDAVRTVFDSIPTTAGTRATINRLSETEIFNNESIPDLLEYGESDADNALRINAVAKGRFHYVNETGQWIIWNGCRWIPDKDGFMTRLHLATMEETARQGLHSGNRHTGEKIVKHAMKSRDASKTAATLTMLKSVAGVTVSATDLDADLWLLGTPNGLIDLRTGTAIEPDKVALITKSIACDYNPDAKCPTWEKVIHTAADGDAELIQFLQSWTGYTLTGSVKEECLAFLHGTGANSKGTVTECIRHLMGDYAITAPESLFTVDRNSSATNDIARLAGCRMACAAELDEGAAFAESRLKAITGRDAITARFLHREFFDFMPTHKFWISGNHKPTVRGNDHGIWRRMRLIPFTVTIPKEQRDLNLADKLKGEMSGILNWAIQGCLAWQKDGLVTPKRVIDATASYQAQEDIVGQFLDDCTVSDPASRCLQSAVFEVYQQWTDKQGIRKPLSASMLNRKFEDRGLHRAKSNGKKYWDGITVKDW
jgi:putative DNA primase/helicase